MSDVAAVTDLRMPQWGMAMKEGAVNKWLKAIGDRVEVDEPLVEVESAKAMAEVVSPVAGTLVEILVAEGEVAEVRAVLARIADAAGPGAAAPAAPGGASRGASVPRRIVPAARRRARELSVDLATVSATGVGGRLTVADVERAAAPPSRTKDADPTGHADRRATPLARKLAAERGINLDAVTGTGPGGRITKEDLPTDGDATPAASATAPLPPAREDEPAPIPMRGVRRVVAERMMRSLHESAQLTLGRRVWMDEAMELRTRLVKSWADDEVRPSYTDLVMAAVAKALSAHPLLNAVLDGTVSEGQIVPSRRVHIGLAVDTPDGLIVPVVRDADRLGLRELARRTTELADGARSRTLAADTLSGSTFTISSLGGAGVEWFTPILNSPEVAILGVGAINETWRRGTDGGPIAAHHLALSLTVDHRVVDGAPAAEFLATVAALLEDPHRLLR